MRDHAGPNRIELDVSMAAEQVRLGIHDAGLEAAIPEGPAPAQLAIDVLDVALTHLLHEPRSAIRCGRSHEQMNVVRHQYVCMNGAFVLGAKLIQEAQVKPIVGRTPEAISVIVSALHDVQRHSGDFQASSTRHGKVLHAGITLDSEKPGTDHLFL
jgi:hypothetical protein